MILDLEILFQRKEGTGVVSPKPSKLAKAVT